MSTTAKRNGRATVKHAQKAIHALQDDAVDFGQQVVDDVRHRVRALSDLGHDRIDQVRGDFLAMVKEHPFRTLAGAVVIGCVAGLLMRRR